MKAVVRIAIALCLCFTVVCACSALEPGDIILRGGAGLIFPNDDSDTLSGVPGAEVEVDSSTTFAFTAGYMMSEHLALELLGIWPANHDVEGDGILPSLGVGNVGELDIFPPTLSLNYYFMPKARFHPHIGAGINYSVYWDTKASAQTKAVLGAGTDLDIKHSVGWALNIGADYDLNEHFFLTANLWYVDIEAEASLKATALGKLDIDVDVDPWVALLGIGYRF